MTGKPHGSFSISVQSAAVHTTTDKHCMLLSVYVFQEYVKTSSRQLDTIKGRKKDYVDNSGAEEGRELQDMSA